MFWTIRGATGVRLPFLLSIDKIMLKNMSKVSKLDTDVWKMENGQEKYNACPKAWEVVKQSSAINIPLKIKNYTSMTGCCKQVAFYETNSTSSFFYGYSSFLGIWYQVK